jgi:hypothetical protein
VGLLSVVAGLGLLVAYPVGDHAARVSHLLVLRRAFGGPVPYVAAAAVLVIAGAVLRPLPVIARAVTFVLGYLALLGCFIVGALMDWDADGWVEKRTIRGPAGSDRRAVVWQGWAVIDPLFRVTVIQGSGPGAHEWTVACFKGDDESREVERTKWTSPDDLLIIDDGGHAHPVHLDPHSGRPRGTYVLEC